MVLASLRKPVSELSLSPKLEELLQESNFHTVAQILLHLPRTYQDRRNVVPLARWRDGPVNTEVQVESHQYFKIKRGTPTLKITVKDDTQAASLLCYGRNNLSYMLKVGGVYRIAGQFQQRRSDLQSSLFEFEPIDAPPFRFGRIVPVYTLSKRISQKVYLKIVEMALELCDQDSHLVCSVPPCPSATLSLAESLQQVHLPNSIAHSAEARSNLAMYELLQLQAMLMWLRNRHSNRPSTRTTPPSSPAVPSSVPSSLSSSLSFSKPLNAILNSLPFSLTQGQHSVLQEICHDLRGATPMRRLLQGDVGAGKTVVALLASLLIMEEGHQVAFMAPTELLAQQHYATALHLLESLSIRISLLTGSLSESERMAVRMEAEGGAVALIIGTHALFSQEVRFRALKLVIIDEQQRFGVKQRMALINKSNKPHLLMMTATPIPRTLALSQFKGFNISEIRTLPKNRVPVKTHLAKKSNEHKVFGWIAQELARGHQAYVVCPVIAQSESGAVRDVHTMHAMLAATYLSAYTIAIIHSQIPEPEKEEIMRKFSEGDINVLVATSVIEVGIHVPNATCMVIDHAERFGLSTLHQLRGRVGRSSFQSYTFLIYNDSNDLTPIAGERLKLLLHEHDGFNIAEADMFLRGSGDLMGTQQSGYYHTQIARFPEHLPLLTEARKAAETIIAHDPALEKEEHLWLRGAT